MDVRWDTTMRCESHKPCSFHSWMPFSLQSDRTTQGQAIQREMQRGTAQSSVGWCHQSRTALLAARIWNPSFPLHFQGILGHSSAAWKWMWPWVEEGLGSDWFDPTNKQLDASMDSSLRNRWALGTQEMCWGTERLKSRAFQRARRAGVVIHKQIRIRYPGGSHPFGQGKMAAIVSYLMELHCEHYEGRGEAS